MLGDRSKPTMLGLTALSVALAIAAAGAVEAENAAEVSVRYEYDGTERPEAAYARIQKISADVCDVDDMSAAAFEGDRAARRCTADITARLVEATGSLMLADYHAALADPPPQDGAQMARR